MTIRKVAIIGTGNMGLSLAQVIARAGYSIILKSRTSGSLANGLEIIKASLQQQVASKKISAQESVDIVNRITGTTVFSCLSQCDLVIEAVIENFEVKAKLFKELGHVCKENVVLSSNTSSLSISELAIESNRPEHFVGLHFFNPPTKMKLVEVIKGRFSSAQSVDRAIGFINSLGKNPILINDSPGFLVNRLLFPMINEAIAALTENIASKEAIDASMKFGANHPMGPLELADLIGLDTCLEVLENLHKMLGDSKFMPSPLLRAKVEKGDLGRKTGQGFYSYS